MVVIAFASDPDPHNGTPGNGDEYLIIVFYRKDGGVEFNHLIYGAHLACFVVIQV